jgi:hypothetical protein
MAPEARAAGDALAFTDDVRPGGAADVIRACAALEPVVERRLVRRQAVDFMIFSQRLRRRKRHAHSQTAGVCMLLRRRLFGHGGAFRRARNCRYAFGLTVRTVRSSEVSLFMMGGAASGVQNKTGAILARELRGSIDQFAQLGLDADVERFARALEGERKRA